MKENNTSKLIGTFFIIVSIIGILFSLTGMTTIWILKPRMQKSAKDFLTTSEDFLENTNESLMVLDSALENTRENLLIIEESFNDLDTTFSSVSESLDIASTLVGDDLSQTIVNAQTALSSSASTAQIIDRTLLFIASIPLIGADYRPEVPLHISLEEVASELEDVPASLKIIEQSMNDTSEGILILNDNLSELTGNLGDFDADLADAQDVLNEYISILNGFLDRIRNLQKNLSLYIILLSLFFTGLFLLLGTSQVSVLLHGLAYREGEQRVIYLSDLRKKQPDSTQEPTTKED